LYLRTFVEGLRTFHMHTLRTVCSDVGLRITTFYRIFSTHTRTRFTDIWPMSQRCIASIDT